MPCRPAMALPVAEAVALGRAILEGDGTVECAVAVRHPKPDEMIQEIAERSGGAWKPSPGSVYPTLQLLVDEGLILGAETDGKKKLFELTVDGRTAAGKIATPPWEQIAEGIDPAQQNLRAAAGQLFGALAQSVHAAGPEQQKRIIDIVNNARREIYQILGESE